MVKVVVIVAVVGCMFEVKGTIMQIEKAVINYCLGVLKVSHSNYLQLCSGLPVTFAIFLKSSLLLKGFYCLFCS